MFSLGDQKRLRTKLRTQTVATGPRSGRASCCPPAPAGECSLFEQTANHLEPLYVGQCSSQTEKLFPFQNQGCPF